MSTAIHIEGGGHGSTGSLSQNKYVDSNLARFSISHSNYVLGDGVFFVDSKISRSPPKFTTYPIFPFTITTYEVLRHSIDFQIWLLEFGRTVRLTTLAETVSNIGKLSDAVRTP